MGVSEMFLDAAEAERSDPGRPVYRSRACMGALAARATHPNEVRVRVSREVLSVLITENLLCYVLFLARFIRFIRFARFTKRMKQVKRVSRRFIVSLEQARHTSKKS